ncbi:MAG: pirin family protein [Anaerolineaceae bacterium]|nr:pirin family protein [Anaerolineaceae bacterium]
MERKIQERITGYRTQDGAGVSLVRVLGNQTALTFDPILLLDSFDSTNPAEYIAGFPLHPHRGIETISLIVRGNMVHKDSLGNSDAISDGEVQWMTAGSGILHEERLPASERMLGVQLWLNMPKKDKMAPPAYRSIHADEIESIQIEGGTLRLISGEYLGHQGHLGKYHPLDYYDIRLEPNQKWVVDTDHDKSVMVFTLLGDAKIAGEVVREKTAVKLTPGDSLEVESLDNEIILLFISSAKLDEPIAWGGPIVMNTREELETAFRELRSGTFLKERIDY